MKKLVENYFEFIQSAQIAQNPNAYTMYSANPQGFTHSRAQAIARYAQKCKD